jgi:hypothetical protein
LLCVVTPRLDCPWPGRSIGESRRADTGGPEHLLAQWSPRRRPRRVVSVISEARPSLRRGIRRERTNGVRRRYRAHPKVKRQGDRGSRHPEPDGSRLRTPQRHGGRSSAADSVAGSRRTRAVRGTAGLEKARAPLSSQPERRRWLSPWHQSPYGFERTEPICASGGRGSSPVAHP